MEEKGEGEGMTFEVGYAGQADEGRDPNLASIAASSRNSSSSSSGFRILLEDGVRQNSERGRDLEVSHTETTFPPGNGLVSFFKLGCL